MNKIKLLFTGIMMQVAASVYSQQFVKYTHPDIKHDTYVDVGDISDNDKIDYVAIESYDSVKNTIEQRIYVSTVDAEKIDPEKRDVYTIGGKKNIGAFDKLYINDRLQRTNKKFYLPEKFGKLKEGLYLFNGDSLVWSNTVEKCGLLRVGVIEKNKGKKYYGIVNHPIDNKTLIKWKDWRNFIDIEGHYPYLSFVSAGVYNTKNSSLDNTFEQYSGSKNFEVEICFPNKNTKK